MKYLFHFIIFLWCLCSMSHTFALQQDPDYIFVSEETNGEKTQLIVPEDIDWTQRFILTEMKELRGDIIGYKKEIESMLHQKELALVDRALSYSANTVNFFFVVLTIAIMAIWLFGWKTVRDLKENLSIRFEKEVEKRIGAEQKKLEAFMLKFEDDQLKQSQAILENQAFLQKKQEAAYYWSQYNREENSAQKIDLLESISSIGIQEDEILILIEKSSIYIELELWEKALESSEKGLEISSENTALLYTKAKSLMMLENTEDARTVLINILWLNPAMKQEIIEDELFHPLIPELNEYIDKQEL